MKNESRKISGGNFSDESKSKSKGPRVRTTHGVFKEHQGGPAW